MKRLLAILLLSCAAFAVCPTVGSPGSGQCTVTDADPWGPSSLTRSYFLAIPTGYTANSTAALVIILNGSIGATSSPGSAFDITTGWSKKCASVTPKCAVIGLDSIPASRYHINSITCNGATCTIVSKEKNTGGGGSNVTIADLAGACAGVNSLTGVASTYVDDFTITIPKAVTCTEAAGTVNAYAVYGSSNASFAALMRAQPSDSVDDINFLRKVLATQFPLLLPDKAQVFCSGWSIGTYMCARYAIDMPDIFAAIGMSEGSIGASHYSQGVNSDLDKVFPNGGLPVSVIDFAGGGDSTVPPCAIAVLRPQFQQRYLNEWLPNFTSQNNITSGIPANICSTGTAVQPSTATCNAASSTTGVAVQITATGGTTATLIRASGSWITDGFTNTDFAALTGFSIAYNNNKVCRVNGAPTATNMTVTGCQLLSENSASTTPRVDRNETVTFTTPSPVSTYGFAVSPPNNGVRIKGFAFPLFQEDITLASASASTLVTGSLGNAFSPSASGASQVSCPVGALTVAGTTVEPRPFLPDGTGGTGNTTDKRQINWLASGGDDGSAVQVYALQAATGVCSSCTAGHTYWGGYSATGTTLATTLGTTVTRGSGSFSTDGFGTGDRVGFSAAGGWVTNAGTVCTVTAVAALTLTVGTCSATLQDESLAAGGNPYVTDNVLDAMTSSITGGLNVTDVEWNFFQAHKKPSWWGTRGLRVDNSKF